MKTLKLAVKTCKDSVFVDKKAENYGHAFLRLYNRFDESVDKTFIEELMSDFNMNAREYRYLIKDVKSALDVEESRRENINERIDDYIFELQDEKSTGKQRFNAFRKIAQLLKSLLRDRTWGGLNNMRRLSKECSKENRDEEKIASIRNDIYQSRFSGAYYIGAGIDKGNMNFDFSELDKGKIKYKPYRGKSIEFTFYGAYKYMKELVILKEMALGGLISITMRVSSSYLYLTFDEEILNGYAVDAKERKEEYAKVKELNLPEEEQEAAIKRVTKKYYDEQRLRMLVGKIPDRVFAIDLNPKYIGWAVLEADGNGGYIIIASGMYDLSYLSRKLGKKSSSEEQIKQNNKRKTEIQKLVVKLFKKVKHYKCSAFICEDLDFKLRIKYSLSCQEKQEDRQIISGTVHL